MIETSPQDEGFFVSMVMYYFFLTTRKKIYINS